MGFANDVTTRVFGQTFDRANPFVQVMVSQNLSKSGKLSDLPSIELAIGNQVSWNLVERNLPGSTDKQDTVSLFFNGQVATSIALEQGHVASPPAAQFMLGATFICSSRWRILIVCDLRRSRFASAFRLAKIT